jgi:hypothetical protein
MLYGYEDLQNDWWEEYRRNRLSQFGTLLVYVSVTPSELAAVEFSGFRSLPATSRTLTALSSSDEDLTKDERKQISEAVAVDEAILIRFRVKARAFLDLVAETQSRIHPFRSDQIKDLNNLILEKIEVASAAARGC